LAHALHSGIPARTGSQPLLEQVLAAIIELQGAYLGCMHLYDPTARALRLVAEQGFTEDLECSIDSGADQSTIWNRALEQRDRIVVEDIRADPDFVPYRSAAGAMCLAAQSTPLFSQSGEPLVTISTFVREPRVWRAEDFRFSDLYARLVADLLENQRTSQALAASEARFSSLLQSLPAAVYTCDAAGRVALFNDAAVELWGRTPDPDRDQWCGSFSMYHPDGTPLALEMCPMATALKEGRALSGEVVVERPDGTRRLVHAYPRPLYDNSGSIVGAVNLVLDITDHKITQDALQESEDRFRRYFELGLIGMATTSPTKGILDVNDEICRILGYERDELLQKTWAELTHPDDLPADASQFNRVLTGELDGYALDKRWIRKDGQVIYSIMAAKCLRRPDGTVDYFVGLVQDITARKRAEAETESLKDALAGELSVMTRLHDFSTRILAGAEIQPWLEEVLSALITIQKADFGTFQRYNPEQRTLKIIAQRGFQKDFLEHFAIVRDGTSACGRAMNQRTRVVIEDVQSDQGFEPHRAIAASAGFRAVQSTPLFSRGGELLGVVSTHFREPHVPLERELRWADLYIVHVAQIIEREKNHAALLRYQQELRTLTARLIEAQEVQSRHLARELHDAFSQKLAVIGIEMALAQRPSESPAGLKGRLRRLTEQIGGLAKDIHHISRQLHPAILYDLGLEAALRNECLIFVEQHGIPAHFHPIDIPRNVPDHVALCLYRVAQECLRNVAAHANATSARVSLSADAGEIAMQIIDGGDGFELNKSKGAGLGLISMDERVRLVNGTFSVTSQPGKGTIISVRVPLLE
jgi:PAS domain S-box-containing protein